MTKSKFKVGDKVKIILEDDGSWNEEVTELIGKTVTIKECCAFEGYIILEDNGEYFWSECELELIEEEENNMMRYKAGDRVVIRDDLVVGEDYNLWSFEGDMAKNLGQAVEIKNIDIDNGYDPFYILTDRTKFYTDEMIDHEKTEELNKANKSISKDEIKFKVEDENGNIKTISLEEIRDESIVIHCDTEEIANEYLDILSKIGVSWVGIEDIAVENNYSYYKSNTCYELEDDKLSYSRKSYYLDEGYKIYKYIEKADKLEKSKAFTKSDLKSGHVVRTRDESLYIFMKNEFGGEDYIFNQKTKSHMELFVYNEDLTLNSDYNDEQFDIIEVYEPLVNYALKCVAERAFDTNNDLDEYFKLVYKREEPKEMTLREIEEQLGYKIKLI